MPISKIFALKKKKQAKNLPLVHSIEYALEKGGLEKEKKKKKKKKKIYK